MENAIPIGLSRQIVLGRALEVTANNIANQNTVGYRAERILFEEYLAQSGNPSARESSDISFVTDPDSVTDFSQGTFVQTHATLDFALAEDGFFAVETENGVRYTRDGHFGVSTLGELVNRNGHSVLDDSGTPILINPQGNDLILSPDGELQQDGVPIARLGVFAFDDNQQLRREGNNLYQSTTPGRAIAGAPIQQGFIETSNVQAIEGITNLISISRAYGQASELIETVGELSREAVQTFTETV